MSRRHKRPDKMPSGYVFYSRGQKAGEMRGRSEAYETGYKAGYSAGVTEGIRQAKEKQNAEIEEARTSGFMAGVLETSGG